jgi:hypothetical protein
MILQRPTNIHKTKQKYSKRSISIALLISLPVHDANKVKKSDYMPELLPRKKSFGRHLQPQGRVFWPFPMNQYQTF